MAKACVTLCLIVGLIALVLIGLGLLDWTLEKYMDVRNHMVQIKYGENRIRIINEHWNEILEYIEGLNEDG